MNTHDIETNERNNSPQSTPLRELQPKHKQVARLLVQGYDPKAIASQVNLSVARIYQIKSEAIFQAYMNKLEYQAEEKIVDVRREIQNAAPRALQILEQLLGANSENVQLNAAKDLLDRAGYKPIDKTAHLNLNKLLDEDDLQDIHKRLQEAKNVGVVIDVPESESNGEDT